MYTAMTRRPRRRRTQIAAALISVGALTLSACGSNGDDETDGEETDGAAEEDTDAGDTDANEADAAEEEELTPITVVTFLPLESFTFTPEMVAYSGGYFEEHGLDVTFEPVVGTSAAIQAVVGGAGFITRASTTDLMPAWDDGSLDVVGVGTMARQTVLRIASHEDNPVEGAADMVGETIGMGSVGGTSEVTMDLALQSDDIALDEVGREAVPVTAATFELVRRGDLAGYIVSLDTAYTLDTQNEDAVISAADLDVTPDLQLFFTTPDTLENQPETVEAALAALADATQFVLDDQENDFAETLTLLRDSGDWDFPALHDDAAAVGALNEFSEGTWMDDSGTPLLHTDPDRFQDAYDALTEGGLVEGGQDPSSWFTNDFVPSGG